MNQSTVQSSLSSTQNNPTSSTSNSSTSNQILQSNSNNQIISSNQNVHNDDAGSNHSRDGVRYKPYELKFKTNFEKPVILDNFEKRKWRQIPSTEGKFSIGQPEIRV